MTTVAADQLRTIIERAERLNESKAEVAADLKELFAEAKGNGFDVPILRKIIKIRAMDPAKRQEQEALLDLYMSSVGMV